MVPGENGILPEHRGVTGTLPGKLLGLMGLVVEERRQAKECPP